MRKLICLLAVWLLLAVMPVGAFAEGDVSAMLEALPTVEEFQAMDAEAQLVSYNQVQAAYDAYMALTEEEKAALEGAEEAFETLFAHFNSLVMPVEEMPEEVQEEPAESPMERIGMIAVSMAAFALGFGMMHKKKNGK